MPTTWKELRQQIDDFINKSGLDEDINISYIDISYPQTNEDVSIEFDEDVGLIIY